MFAYIASSICYPYSYSATTEFWISIAIFVAGFILSKIRENNRIRLVIMAIGSFAGIRFLWWRYFHTLNLDGLFNTVASVALVLAESYTVFIFLLFAFQLLRLHRPEKYEKRSASYNPSLDIFIATYNEAPDIVRRTVAGAQSIQYENKKIYILDDGRRDEILEIAEQFQCSYITRPNNKFAKAGNLNNALQQTEGEYVLILDADHVPASDIADLAMYYFETEDNVAMVQFAHRFMNPGPVERNLRLVGTLPGEQELFFQLVQVAKNGWNAAFFAGSAAVFSRKAIESVGGIPTKSVAEDCELTILLHSKGYRTHYVHLPKVLGLSPENLNSYLVQQNRWARGAMQLLRYYNPLTFPGLTFAQRLCYLSGMLHFLFSLPRMVYLCIPSIFLLAGICPLQVDLFEYAVFGAPYLVMYVLNQNYVFENYRHSFWSDVYEVINSPRLCVNVTRTFLSPKSVMFQVTPKGIVLKDFCFDIFLVTPHFFLFIIVLLSYIGALVQLAISQDVVGVLVNSLWNLYTAAILLSAICVAVERPQSRKAHRLKRNIPASLDIEAFDESGETASFVGSTIDINEFGARIELRETPFIEQGKTAILYIEGADEELISIKSKLVRSTDPSKGKVNCCVQFQLEPTDTKLYRQLVDIVYSSNREWVVLSEPVDSIYRSFMRLLSSPVRMLETIIENQKRLHIALLPNTLIAKLMPKSLEPKLVLADGSGSDKTNLIESLEYTDEYEFFHDLEDEDEVNIHDSEANKVTEQ